MRKRGLALRSPSAADTVSHTDPRVRSKMRQKSAKAAKVRRRLDRNARRQEARSKKKLDDQLDDQAKVIVSLSSEVSADADR
jgi:hypothetical protein